MSAPKTIRCAVYTRKSTEHNLDLEFNSLDAQREACEAYIKSQMHEGWKLIPDHYDDGGISGASLDRPDLQRLLGDIRAGKVDIVVVYKVDRLTRSLTDFAKLVELFDAHGVSFVSVTQSFNTTSSMGRLTLNVLLSFAQFEREVIGERVRDKVAASKRKGLWMGGPVPLGYINQDKKLVIVPEEAESVRWIFQRYLELGAIGPLLQELDRVGIKTKPRRYANGRVIGGGQFGKGGLNHLLKNRCYIGEVVHRGQSHSADHEPIVDRSLFDAVQAKMAANNVEKKLKVRGSPYLLTGLIFDSAGNRMSPSHTLKKGIRYRYYVSQAVEQRRKGEAGAIARVPAPDVEALVGELVASRAGTRDTALSREVLEARIYKVSVLADAVEVAMRPAQAPEDPESGPSQAPEIVHLLWARKPFVARKGVAHSPSISAPIDPKARDAALAAIGKSRLWMDELLAGGSLAAIAKREGKGERQIRLLLPLAFAPPSTVRGLIEGTLVPTTVTDMAKELPLSWARTALYGSKCS
jgi:DNA invertase Pin-like site-specific DNA recombinase